MEKLTIEEQEVVINFGRADENATLYTSDIRWIRKMDKMCENYPDDYKCISNAKINGDIVAKTYEFPIALLSLRKSRKRKEVSEETKQARIKNLQNKKNV